MKNVKSKYILQIIFSYLNEKEKLRMVNYNQKLQSSLNINLFNYKYFSGKYLVYENGKINEYDGYTHKLIFEGAYLNGKRNGIGKEYSFGELIFEGEYLNGKRSGKGKEYNHGTLIFEGEYLNGFKNGKGKEYNHDNLIFEGEYLNDQKWNGKGYDEQCNIIYELVNGNGQVKEYCYGKLIFEGEYLKGKRNGMGKEYKYGKLIFEGEYLNGKKWNGKKYDQGYNQYLVINGVSNVKKYNFNNLLL